MKSEMSAVLDRRRLGDRPGGMLELGKSRGGCLTKARRWYKGKKDKRRVVSRAGSFGRRVG